VSRPQLKSNPQDDRVLRSNIRGKKLEVEEHRRNVNLLKNKMSVTACTDSLNAKTLNVKSVSAMCAKCVMIEKHDLYVSKSVAKPLRKTVAFESIKKPRNNVRKLNERFANIYKWSYIKFTPSGYMWKPKSKQGNVNPNLIEIVLFIVDSGCSKHMTENPKLLINFVEKFLGTVKFGNDLIAPILGYGDLVQGAVTIKRVYYVDGLNHNLFSVGQFCDADLEVAFRKSTSKDETPEVLINFLRLVQRGLQAQIKVVQFDKGTEFLNQTLHAYFTAEGILHQTSVARTPEQNGVVERRNRTLVEAARTMISAAKVSLFFWAEAIVTACFTQNYGENLDKIKEKGDECIFVGYSTQSRAYRVFNKRTRVIMESIHVNFDELPHMASDQISSDPAPECQRMVLEHSSLSPGTIFQDNVTQEDRTVTTSNELDLLFSPIEDGNPARANVKQALGRGPYALSWKLCQEDSLNLPDYRYIVDVEASFQLSRIHI
nr:hypothetical protein [Tanacetum cinerariifolium]